MIKELSWSKVFYCLSNIADSPYPPTEMQAMIQEVLDASGIDFSEESGPSQSSVSQETLTWPAPTSDDVLFHSSLSRYFCGQGRSDSPFGMYIGAQLHKLHGCSMCKCVCVCVCAFICAHASIWHCTFVYECVYVCVCVHLALISNHSLYLVLHHLLKNPALFLSSALLRPASNGNFYVMVALCCPFLPHKIGHNILVFGLLQANTNTTLWQHAQSWYWVYVGSYYSFHWYLQMPATSLWYPQQK